MTMILQVAATTALLQRPMAWLARTAIKPSTSAAMRAWPLGNLPSVMTMPANGPVTGEDRFTIKPRPIESSSPLSIKARAISPARQVRQKNSQTTTAVPTLQITGRSASIESPTISSSAGALRHSLTSVATDRSRLETACLTTKPNIKSTNAKIQMTVNNPKTTIAVERVLSGEIARAKRCTGR